MGNNIRQKLIRQQTELQIRQSQYFKNGVTTEYKWFKCWSFIPNALNFNQIAETCFTNAGTWYQKLKLDSKFLSDHIQGINKWYMERNDIDEKSINTRKPSLLEGLTLGLILTNPKSSLFPQIKLHFLSIEL